MSVTKVTFSVNDYDQDGDIHQYGIFLHHGITRFKVADSIEELPKFMAQLDAIYKEITENYDADGRSR